LSVTPIPEGVLVKKGLDVRGNALQWTVIIVIDDPRPALAAEIEMEITALRSLLASLPPVLVHHVHNSYWNSELDRASTRLNLLYHLHQRHKRGLFDFIGRISQDLFGTATQEEVSEIKEKVEENRDAVNGVVHLQQELLSIVNTTHYEMERNRQVLNELVEGINNLTDWVYRMRTELTTAVDGLVTYNGIAEKVSLIWHHVHILEDVAYVQGIQRNALEQGRLHEQLLPREVLKEVASLQTQPATQLVDPIEWYYSNVKLTPLWKERSVAYRVTIPLVDATPFIGYEVETFPIPLENSSATARLLATGTIAMDTRTGGVFRVQNCFGHQPTVCNPSPLRQNAHNKDCVHAIILNGDVRSACPAEIDPHPTNLLFPGLPNHIVLVTWHDQIFERCPGKKESVQEVSRGTYQVEWSGECILSTDNWRIPGLVTKETRKLISEEHWEALDLTEFDLHDLASHQLKINPLEASFPGQLPPPAKIYLSHKIPSPLPPIKWTQTGNIHYLWLLLVIVIIIATASTLYSYYRYCYQPKKPTSRIAADVQETELQTMSSATQSAQPSAPHSSPQPVPFKFNPTPYMLPMNARIPSEHSDTISISSGNSV
jgi:uncharacterized protein YaaW (UPF0174 family)